MDNKDSWDKKTIQREAQKVLPTGWYWRYMSLKKDDFCFMAKSRRGHLGWGNGRIVIGRGKTKEEAVNDCLNKTTSHPHKKDTKYWTKKDEEKMQRRING